MDFWTRPLLFLPGLTYPQFPNVNLSYSTNSTPVFQSVSLNTCLPPSNNPQGFVPLPTCQQDHPASISCPVQHGKANDIKRLFLILSRHQKLHDVNDGSDRNWQNDSVTRFLESNLEVVCPFASSAPSGRLVLWIASKWIENNVVHLFQGIGRNEWKRLCSSWIIHSFYGDWWHYESTSPPMGWTRWIDFGAAPCSQCLLRPPWVLGPTDETLTRSQKSSCLSGKNWRNRPQSSSFLRDLLSSSSVKSKITWQISRSNKVFLRETPSLCLIISIDIQIGIVQVLTLKILQRYCKDTANIP